LFETEVMPFVPETMPANVKELFAWLKAWDKTLSSKVQRVLEIRKEYLSYRFATFAIKSPIGWLGFGFEIDQMHRLGYANKPSKFKQYLHGHGEKIGILRLMIDECSPEFVHSRNLTFQDLRNKKIAVIGCGAIGSQVIPGLVRLGAGSGNGVIEIIDDGYIETENLGRHYLGFSALYQRKVNALEKELKRQFPIANIRTKCEAVKSLEGLESFDLVIDATGEEAVSEMLNAYRIKLEKDLPLLHVRVRGNGDSVQTFWAQGKKYGCFRCLLNPSGKEYRQEKYRLLKSETLFKQIGCSAFTPYAINAPISAAALALEVVVDWLKTKNPSPRFRTRSCSRANVYEVKDQNVKRQQGCPACDS
jgi:molybdopterin/thiamine biosynthesis adenylyltransferase